MTNPSWGLLGPEFLANSRRTRSLGLGAVIREFNDLAVPGLGGVWFAKQLFLAALGVHVANKAEAQNIEVANAIEALGCKLAFEHNNWTPDSRLRGRTKLRSKTDLRFHAARRLNYYVTQPMRMATVQALPALGFVDTGTGRFNAFVCSPVGEEFVREGCTGFSPYNRNVVDQLVRWVNAIDDHVSSPQLRRALSPIEQLPARALSLLQEQLIRLGMDESTDDSNRRRDALEWVESRRIEPQTASSWDRRPVEISSDQHWLDLKAGASFFAARDAAVESLDALETQIENQEEQSLALNSSLNESVVNHLNVLRQRAQDFLTLEHQDEEAGRFCRQCVAADDAQILKALVERDGRVLRLIGSMILPGSAFGGVDRIAGGVDSDEQSEDQEPQHIEWPNGISYRISNLFLLNLDLHGELDKHLAAQDTEST